MKCYLFWNLHSALFSMSIFPSSLVLSLLALFLPSRKQNFPPFYPVFQFSLHFNKPDKICSNNISVLDCCYCSSFSMVHLDHPFYCIYLRRQILVKSVVLCLLKKYSTYLIYLHNSVLKTQYLNSHISWGFGRSKSVSMDPHWEPRAVVGPLSAYLFHSHTLVY